MVEAVAEDVERANELELANAVFYWLQGPEGEPPESDIFLERCDTVVGGLISPQALAALVTEFDREGRLAMQLYLAGFSREILDKFIEQMEDPEAFEHAVNALDDVLDPVGERTLDTDEEELAEVIVLYDEIPDQAPARVISVQHSEPVTFPLHPEPPKVAQEFVRREIMPAAPTSNELALHMLGVKKESLHLVSEELQRKVLLFVLGNYDQAIEMYLGVDIAKQAETAITYAENIVKGKTSDSSRLASEYHMTHVEVEAKRQKLYGILATLLERSDTLHVVQTLLASNELSNDEVEDFVDAMGKLMDETSVVTFPLLKPIPSVYHSTPQSTFDFHSDNRELLIGVDPIELWQERALCAQTDPEAFFPEKGGSTREAKRVCLSCDVRGECLEYALEHEERFGIWGGLSERERRKLKKRN